MSDTSKLAFPLRLPASLSVPDAIRRNDWAAFRELAFVEDHWALKNWAPGRSGYYWYLTFSDRDLSNFARRCQESLGTASLDSVPADGLHITVMGIGDTSDVTENELHEIAGLAQKALEGFESFEVSVGPLAGSRSAIRFSVAPWDRLLDLHRVLRECTTSVRPDQQHTDTAAFRPHLGIAYVNERQEASGLIDRVSALRNLPPVVVSVEKVNLVRLSRVDREYRWRDYAIILLDHQLSSEAAKSLAMKDHSFNLPT